MNLMAESYSENFTTEESEMVQKLMKKSEVELNYIDTICGRQVGMLLKMLIKIGGIKKILEIGTFTGYSAMMMAEALPEDGHITTCEINERFIEIAKPFFDREKYQHKITLIEGDARETVPSIKSTFDLVFIDADKANYLHYYELAKAKLNPNGIIVIDNTLWGGEAIDHSSEKGEIIDELNRKITDDDTTEQVMLPVNDGITIVRLK